MLLYFDTGSLVKLFIDEKHSDRVREWVDAVDVVLTCRKENMTVLHPQFRLSGSCDVCI